MVQYRLGYFAVSLCGHDKGRLYMIVGEDKDMLELCDGTHRFLANPKRKKKMHVQMVRSALHAEAFMEMIRSSEPDGEIRRAVEDMADRIRG